MISLANISLYLSPQTPPSMGLSHHTTAFVVVTFLQGEVLTEFRKMDELSHVARSHHHCRDVLWFSTGTANIPNVLMYMSTEFSIGISMPAVNHRRGMKCARAEFFAWLSAPIGFALTIVLTKMGQSPRGDASIHVLVPY